MMHRKTAPGVSKQLDSALAKVAAAVPGSSIASYASTGANAIWNRLTADNTLQLAEGLDVFRVPVPDRGRTLRGAYIMQSEAR